MGNIGGLLEKKGGRVKASFPAQLLNLYTLTKKINSLALSYKKFAMQEWGKPCIDYHACLHKIGKLSPFNSPFVVPSKLSIRVREKRGTS